MNKENKMNKEKNQLNLFNAAVIGENPEASFIVEQDNQLHAVEQHVADLKKAQSDPKKLIPLMREALKVLIPFATGKVPAHFLDIDWESFTKLANEEELLIHHITNIYTHLPHQDRMSLSRLIHHAHIISRK
jgi:hypothetical protein